jgi:hypothetical protein
MKLSAALATFALLAACGGGDAAKKDEMNVMEQKMRTKMAEDQSALRAEIAKLREDMNRIEVLAKKFELMAQQMDKTGVLTKVETANNNVIKSLEVQEQYLKQLLDSIRALIDELKRK